MSDAQLSRFAALRNLGNAGLSSEDRRALLRQVTETLSATPAEAAPGAVAEFDEALSAAAAHHPSGRVVSCLVVSAERVWAASHPMTASWPPCSVLTHAHPGQWSCTGREVPRQMHLSCIAPMLSGHASWKSER